MGFKIIASIGGVLLLSLAAVGAFASQDGVSTQGEEPTATATDTETATATPTETEEADTPTPTDTATAEPEDTPEATDTPEDGDEDGDGDDVHGIPDDNPSKEPNDDDVPRRPAGRLRPSRSCRVPARRSGCHGLPRTSGTSSSRPPSCLGPRCYRRLRTRA